MRALVVYESMFGNTEQAARAIATGLTQFCEVEVADVREIRTSELGPLDLLVLGGPTHAFSLSRPSTRQDAISQGAPRGSTDTGIREWIGRLRPPSGATDVAVFDTRVGKVRHLPGSAAAKAARLIRRLGFRVVGQESFYVNDTAGPLLPGELHRATSWGVKLGRRMPAVDIG